MRSLLGRDNEVTAAILLPAVLPVFGAEWSFFAFADDEQAVRSDAEANQIASHRVGAPVPQRQVVLTRAASVAVTLDRDVRGRPPLQPVRVPLEARPRVLANLPRQS